MIKSRYQSSTRAFGYRGVPRVISLLRNLVSSGGIPVRELVVSGNQRLDTLAGEQYGDSRYWWVLAAASNIGWGLQVPPGTVIYVPDLERVLRLF